MVIGYKRMDQFVENPPSQTIFHAGDILWVVGEKTSVDELEQLRSEMKV